LLFADWLCVADEDESSGASCLLIGCEDESLGASCMLIGCFVAGIPHLESLQVLSSMSQNNIREALSQFDREARRNVETHLADVEASFDLGYLQTDDGSPR